MLSITMRTHASFHLSHRIVFYSMTCTVFLNVFYYPIPLSAWALLAKSALWKLKLVPTLPVGTGRREKRTNLFNTWTLLVPKTLNLSVQAQVSPYSLSIRQSVHISLNILVSQFKALRFYCAFGFSPGSPYSVFQTIHLFGIHYLLFGQDFRVLKQANTDAWG